MSDYHRYVSALNDYPAPALFLDLDAFEKNIQWAVQNAHGKKIRIASKSIRSVGILKKILSASPIFQGLMTFTLAESLWLRSIGFDDILIGYPTIDHASLTQLASNPEGITLMVDRVEHLDVIQKAVGKTGAVINICLDIDMSMDLPGVRFGVYRSHLKSPSRLKTFLSEVSKRKYLRLVGAMGYEAQIAGVMDSSKFIRGLKTLSLLQLKERRQSMLKIIQEHGFQLSLINGGGSGSLLDTVKEKSVTEVTVGSAFFAPVQFDHYDAFKFSPSLFFSTPVLRKPERGIITVLGGGYIASGTISEIKQPLPWLPEGLTLFKNEGAGEVQTPLALGKNDLTIGDLVIMRHAKAGEICERFNEILIIRNQKVEETIKTYRGDGKCYL